MIDFFLDPFQYEFLQRALLGGVLAATICAIVGTWVVLRGLAFMGDALAHGVLPGIALAFLWGFDLTVGALVSAAVMVAGINLVNRRGNLREDTGIGLLFVGMLALGVVIISRAATFTTDLTGFLFGNVLGVTTGDLVAQAVAAALTLVACTLAYRPFLALAFNQEKAALLGLRPRLANVVLLALVAVAVVSSFRAVGTLLVFGLLIAPPATASLLVRRVPSMMATAVVLGVASVTLGLVLSYHLDTAAGATMAGTSVLVFFVVLAATELARAIRRPAPVA
ncbi:MAG: metal ABC transporter permease [Acidimicrobiales bacterium]|nr:metal ABC transporter permease [Acidimicrobiales bacterium]